MDGGGPGPWPCVGPALAGGTDRLWLCRWVALLSAEAGGTRRRAPPGVQGEGHPHSDRPGQLPPGYLWPSLGGGATGALPQRGAGHAAAAAPAASRVVRGGG